MKTKNYNTYTFAEISPAAKERAKDQYAEGEGFHWSHDYLASLKALAVHFGGKLKRYEIDWFGGSRSFADFDMPDDDLGFADEADTFEASVSAKLAELGAFDPVTLKGHGDCKLTGFCADESAIDGFRQAWHAGERDFDQLMQAAFKEWLKDAQADCADQYSDEQFSEHCEANDYEFTEDGRID